MKPYYIDEKTGISYTLQGDYYLPDLTLPAEEQNTIGVWGQRHLKYIKQYHKMRYTNLLTSGKLNTYLANIDKQATELFFRLVKQMAECEDVTEQLKVNNQMEWVARMNSIRSRNSDLIYI